MANKYETLKQILFRRAKVEYDFYRSMCDNPDTRWSQAEVARQLQCYLNIWQVIAEAHLEEEFYARCDEEKHNEGQTLNIATT